MAGLITLYPEDGSPAWHGSSGMYEVICEYALQHPALQAYPEFAMELQQSLLYSYLDLGEYGTGENRAFAAAVADLLAHVASAEGQQEWGEAQPRVYEKVEKLHRLLQEKLAGMGDTG